MSENRKFILDEMAKLMQDSMGVAQGVRKEAETVMRHQFERFLSDMELVRREDFEILRDMVQKLWEENASLKKRIDALEKKK